MASAKVRQFITEFDSDGGRRIVVLDGSDRVKEGAFASYRGIAFLQFEGKNYMAVGDYLETLQMRSGVVYEFVLAVPNVVES